MNDAIVTSMKAVLRDRPGGRKVATLTEGTPLTVKGGPAAWAEVACDGKAGVLSRRSFRFTPDKTGAKVRQRSREPTVPPAAQPSDISVSGSKVKGPGGIVFGTLFQLGLFNYGQTSLDAFFNEDPGAFPELSASVLRVMRAVSANEGKLEAINTWDNAILSCSIYQWTVSAGTGAGELPYALSVLKRRSPATFASYFGDLGIDVVATEPKPFAVGRGFFKLSGQVLNTDALKAPLRSHIWAYRFWRAAHDRDVRRAYIRVAVDRIPVFYGPPVAALGNRPLSTFVTSEEAVAQLLDQHVNRPGHVPQTLVQAIQDVITSSGKPDPATWTDAEERAVVARYLERRRATSMTNSAARAQRIKDEVVAGRLSDRRGSFR